MAHLKKPPSFRELLAYCTDRSSPYWEAGWREFLNRYNDTIYRVVTQRCWSWKAPRLRNQLSEVVNDIVGEVFLILVNRLHNFHDFENEHVFPYWLTTLCNRAASNYLNRRFVPVLIEEDLEEIQSYISNLEFDTSFELYEYIVERLRTSYKKREKNIERDINIFYLYAWEGLTRDEILSHPCFMNFGHRVVDNVVNRVRSYLRNEVYFQ